MSYFFLQDFNFTTILRITAPKCTYIIFCVTITLYLQDLLHREEFMIMVVYREAPRPAHTQGGLNAVETNHSQ
jgi:hypothetical protein